MGSEEGGGENGASGASVDSLEPLVVEGSRSSGGQCGVTLPRSDLRVLKASVMRLVQNQGSPKTQPGVKVMVLVSSAHMLVQLLLLPRFLLQQRFLTAGVATEI